MCSFSVISGMSVQGEKCEFTNVNDHFLTQEWRV